MGGTACHLCLVIGRPAEERPGRASFPIGCGWQRLKRMLGGVPPGCGKELSLGLCVPPPPPLVFILKGHEVVAAFCPLHV